MLNIQQSLEKAMVDGQQGPNLMICSNPPIITNNNILCSVVDAFNCWFILKHGSSHVITRHQKCLDTIRFHTQIYTSWDQAFSGVLKLRARWAVPKYSMRNSKTGTTTYSSNLSHHWFRELNNLRCVYTNNMDWHIVDTCK
jgi:hypothetical protein